MESVLRVQSFQHFPKNENLRNLLCKTYLEDSAVAKQCLWALTLVYVSIVTLFYGHVKGNFKV